MRDAPDLPQPPAWTGARAAPRRRSAVPAAARPGVRLEPELWDALADICRREGATLDALIARIAAAGGQASDQPGLTSAVRVFIVAYYRQACRTANPIARSLQIVSESAEAS